MMQGQHDMTAARYDFEAVLPLSLIRQHTKTDDIPGVTDALLSLYRSAALEAAQKYTGLLLTGRMIFTEPVTLPRADFTGRGPRRTWHHTKHPVASPMVYLYGAGGGVITIHAVVGERRVPLPETMSDFGLGCCNPCASDQGPRVMYTAGYPCEADFPTAVKLGALKYIAHVIENPGDVVGVVSESGNAASSGGVGNANNPALASGAIEIWRSCVDDAI